MRDWDDVVRLALALPGASEGASYGKPAIKVAGKMIAATTAPDPGSFVVHASLPEKEVLIETDPATFWETGHYRGWPAVLVRYGGGNPERVALVIRRAWWDRLPARQRREAGDRP